MCSRNVSMPGPWLGWRPAPRRKRSSTRLDELPGIDASVSAGSARGGWPTPPVLSEKHIPASSGVFDCVFGCAGQVLIREVRRGSGTRFRLLQQFLELPSFLCRELVHDVQKCARLL